MRILPAAPQPPSLTATRVSPQTILAQIKNGISHRYRSLDKLRAYLLDGHAAAAAADGAAGGQQ